MSAFQSGHWVRVGVRQKPYNPDVATLHAAAERGREVPFFLVEAVLVLAFWRFNIAARSSRASGTGVCILSSASVRVEV